MRICFAVTIVAAAMLASPIASGQVPTGNRPIGTPGKSAKPPGVFTPTKPGSPPPTDALSDLAGGGYADPNYVPPGTKPGKTPRHRAMRMPRTHWASRQWAWGRFTGYNSYKAFPYAYCSCYCVY